MALSPCSICECTIYGDPTVWGMDEFLCLPVKACAKGHVAGVVSTLVADESGQSAVCAAGVAPPLVQLSADDTNR